MKSPADKRASQDTLGTPSSSIKTSGLGKWALILLGAMAVSLVGTLRYIASHPAPAISAEDIAKMNIVLNDTVKPAPASILSLKQSKPAKEVVGDKGLAKGESSLLPEVQRDVKTKARLRSRPSSEMTEGKKEEDDDGVPEPTPKSKPKPKPSSKPRPKTKPGSMESGGSDTNKPNAKFHLKPHAADSGNVESGVAAEPSSGPDKSPQEGSDILSNPMSLINCRNQTQCIRPHLELAHTFKVYYCSHNAHGIRFYYLVKEGLLLHPRVELVGSPDEADLIVFLPESMNWGKSECGHERFFPKMVIMDEGDWPDLFSVDTRNWTEHNPGVPWHVGYFKRSFIRRSKGNFKGLMPWLHNANGQNVFPMTYPVANAYIKSPFTKLKDREYEIVCTLRGSKGDPARLKVQEWTKEYVRARGIKKAITGEVNHESRRTISKGYFHQLQTAQIVVSSNPSGWEGDFRLMEAMGSGALVFVDNMMVPRPFPLVNHRHVVYYDNLNKTAFFDKLDHYRTQKNVARKVAVGGYLHVMKYHRAACLIDYVLRSVHHNLYHVRKHIVVPKPPVYKAMGPSLRERIASIKAGRGRQGRRLLEDA